MWVSLRYVLAYKQFGIELRIQYMMHERIPMKSMENNHIYLIAKSSRAHAFVRRYNNDVNF